MKPLLLTALITLLLTSCSIYLEKRRYNKGFFVTTSTSINNIGFNQEDQSDIKPSTYFNSHELIPQDDFGEEHPEISIGLNSEEDSVKPKTENSSLDSRLTQPIKKLKSKNYPFLTKSPLVYRNPDKKYPSSKKDPTTSKEPKYENSLALRIILTLALTGLLAYGGLQLFIISYLILFVNVSFLLH